MSGTGSFLVEEFINSITVQLDRVQDSLRLKSVNRPLTYALKDFSLDLQVFIELDVQGNVRFRNSAPNETGASTVRLGFTTITKPMIEENTISLAVSRSPSLDQIGLEPEERRKLEQLGVRNAAQLQNLYSSTGAPAMSRLSDVPLDRIRQALQRGKPQVKQVIPVPRAQAPVKGPTAAPSVPRPPVIAVPARTPHLQLRGSGLVGPAGPATVRLNRVPLSMSLADDESLVVNLPDASESGALEITLPDGEVLEYHLDVHGVEAHSHDGHHTDRWEPAEERV